MPSCRRRVRYRSVSPLRGSDGRADDRCAGVHACALGYRLGAPPVLKSGVPCRSVSPLRGSITHAPSTQGLRPGLPTWSTSGARSRRRVGERRGSCDQRRGKCHHMGEKINHRRGRIITRAAHAIAFPAHVIARAAPRRHTGRGADQNRGTSDQRRRGIDHLRGKVDPPRRAVDQRCGPCDDKNGKCDHKNGGCDPPRGVDHHVLGPCGPLLGVLGPRPWPGRDQSGRRKWRHETALRNRSRQSPDA
jgi:hypothetical protein